MPCFAAAWRQMSRSASLVSSETPAFSQRVGVAQAARASSRTRGRAIGRTGRRAAILPLCPGDRHQFVTLVAHAEGGQAVLGIEALRLVVLPVEPAIRPRHWRRGDVEERLLVGRPAT